MKGSLVEEQKMNVCRRGKGTHTFSNMSSGVFYCGVQVNVGEQPKAEAVLIVGRISETIHQHTCGGGVERFAHAVVELVVHNRAPVLWFLITNSLNICKKERNLLTVMPVAPQPETTL